MMRLDRSKTSERNECIIRCRITCNGASASFSTGLHTSPVDWQSKIGRIKVAANRANAVNLIVILHSLLHFFESLLLCSNFCSRK